MIKINRKVEYALMVLKLMKDKDANELTTAREVCDKFETPFDTTAKVMQLMNTAGILHSQKGVKGGYTLSGDLSQVSYMALVEIIEGKSFMMDCHEGPCELIHQCNIGQPIKRLNDYLINIFNALSLNELLAEDNLLALKKLPEKKVEDCPIVSKVNI
ncbi:MAG: Rrf2 family transcriptional regulator [Bacteriovoracaceae bacterium]|nr:Rrf2 family transcriptional regulator [Bacteriovoracaceae bacterium]